MSVALRDAVQIDLVVIGRLIIGARNALDDEHTFHGKEDMI